MDLSNKRKLCSILTLLIEEDVTASVIAKSISITFSDIVAIGGFNGFTFTNHYSYSCMGKLFYRRLSHLIKQQQKHYHGTFYYSMPCLEQCYIHLYDSDCTKYGNSMARLWVEDYPGQLDFETAFKYSLDGVYLLAPFRLFLE